MKTPLIILFTFLSLSKATCQTYPSFGNEKDVTINGLAHDAMEPYISADGNYLFFNNLNDGINTKIYYANKVNDSTFNFVGELSGTNQTTQPFLDAVPDIDSLSNFYWTSTRNYPADLDNLFHGSFSSGNVTNIGRVRGDFNKNIPGWLVMDHTISIDGQLLYYNNARLNSETCLGPCETEIGIAQKQNDSTFNKIPNSDTILQYINDTSYIYYAPCISSDNLEFYYTRYPKGEISTSTIFEICVSVRYSKEDVFSSPKMLFTGVIEAPTLTLDKKIMYYHRKVSGIHKIVMRYRLTEVNIANPHAQTLKSLMVFPNPAKNEIHIQPVGSYAPYLISIYSITGELVKTEHNQNIISVEQLSPGIYFLKAVIYDKTLSGKFVKFE